jgi:hypothetical protein
MPTERSARLLALLVTLMCWIVAGAPILPADVVAAEACAGSPSGLLLLDPGDDESGIGGTGRGPDPSLRAHAGDDEDSGTGGTGHVPRPADDGDSGVGGTGIFGTVGRGDRLCVNGLAIEVPETLTIESSTEGSSGDRLAAGQVVFVQASRSEDGLVARRIVLLEDQAGQIEVFDPARRELIVSGRRVRLAEDLAWGDALALDSLKAGQWISVHGLIDPDRVLVASRIESGRAGAVRQIDDSEGQRAHRWLAQAGPFEYVSIEGFLTGTRERPRLAGFALELGAAVSDTLRERVQPGSRVRTGGRIDAAGTLRVRPPPRPDSARDTAPGRPEIRPGSEPAPPNAGEAPIRPDSPELPEAPSSRSRPRDELPPRPDKLRPEIRRPVKRPAAINRPTRDVLPRR